MRTRISGVSVALAAAGILCLGSNLPASHGHGGGGGGGGHHGGFSGGGHHMGGGHHFSSGGFSGGHHSGYSGHHSFGGGGSRQFSAPSQHFGGHQGSGRSTQSFGSSHHGHQFNGGMSGGGVRSSGGGSFQGGQHQHHTAQPSFSNRHAGSNLAGSPRANGGGSGSVGRSRGGSGSGQIATGNHHGLSGSSSPSRHVTGGGSGSSNSFASRHTAHATNSGPSGNSRGGAQHAHHLSGTGSGRGLGQGSGQGTARGPGQGQGNNFASRHNGPSGHQGLASVADRTGGARQNTGSHRNHAIPNGAVGANRVGSGHGHTVNAHQMWNHVGRGVGTGLASFHGHHRVNHVGGVNGNNFARGGYRHGYYGNNFRYNRVWFGFGSGFWPYYAWNYRPFWGGGWGGWGGGYRYGWGWGRPWRFGFGYPYFGLGYGWGGYGGYGLGYGLGGYGYGGYGGGYGYNSCCAYTPGYSVYSNGYSYAPSSYYGNAPVATDYSVGNAAPTSAPVQVAQADPGLSTVRAQSADSDLDFGAAGEAEFKAGNYEKAAKTWKHAVLDDPKNGVLVMMLGQGLFASGKFDEAAGATQQGMMLLKEEDWGVVVSNYRELYAKIGDYTTQLRVLEKARKDKPEDPALRFLLGFHYAYLGFPNEAVKELDKAISLAPQDELAARLKDVLDAKQKKASGKSKSTAADSIPVPPVPILKKDD